MKIISGRDIYGQHGKTFLFLGVNEVHVQRDYALIEGLQLDPTRPDSMIWFESYDTLFRKPGVPIYDMMVRGKAGTDRRFYFSWYAGDYCSDPSFSNLPTPERRANPSMGAPGSGLDMLYIEQQRLRLPNHIFRRLHLNQGGQPTGAAYNAEMIADAVERGVSVRLPETGNAYQAFVDMSGGSSDDACLAIGHKDRDGRAIIDRVMNQGPQPPFDPSVAVKRFVAVLKDYRCFSVTGDHYAGETFAAAFVGQGVSYMVSQLSKSDIYQSIEPNLNAGKVVLLDVPELENQFLGLVWRGNRIDHLPSEHDDWSNACAGAINKLMSGTEIDMSLAHLGAHRTTAEYSDYAHPMDKVLDDARRDTGYEGHFARNWGRRFDW